MKKGIRCKDTLLDSGASQVLTVYPEDFVSMENHFVTISGVGGYIKAQFGKLRRNKLGLETGLLCDDLPVGRLIPTKGLIEENNTILLSKNRSEIFSDNLRYPVPVFQNTDGMPCIDYEILIEEEETALTASNTTPYPELLCESKIKTQVKN